MSFPLWQRIPVARRLVVLGGRPNGSRTVRAIGRPSTVVPPALKHGSLLQSKVSPAEGANSRQFMASAAASMAIASAGALKCNTVSQVSIEKPDSHSHRSYQHVELANGLQVILASDPACDKAAAALCVGIGRLHEPKDMPGLAHFCEHMLFLGTERFPDEAEYKRFVNGHGGHCNASTGDAQTCYAFDIAPKSLRGALDRFSQFFVAPLFTESATERELNAVDSEHSMRITDDGRRRYATYLLDANPAHPLHWGSGNAASLRDEPRARGQDPHAEVVKFHRDTYSAGDMTLAVLGQESLQELLDIVTPRFSEVRNLGRPSARGDEHGGDEPAIRPADFPGLILRVPSKDVRLLAFSWQLPDWQVPLWRSKPTAYAAHLLGHEGKGSLLSALKAKGWSTALSAGADEFGCFSHFRVAVTLTEAGLDHVKEVGALVFSYIRLLQRTPVERWRLEEMSTERELRFRFADDMQPYALVNALARRLQNYPAEHVMSASSKLFQLDADAACKVLAAFTVGGVRVELTGKRFKERCTERDPWYNGQYSKLPLELEWRDAWTKAASADKLEPDLQLPDPNPFLPEDLDLRALPPSIQPHPVELDSSSGLLAPSMRVFFRQDDRFRQPKATMTFRIYSPASVVDTASYLRSQVWCNAVMEELQEYAYDAGAAGLSYRLSAFPGWLSLSVSGFNDKLPVLLKEVARKMRATSTVAPGTFAIVRDRFERSLRNRAFKQRPVDHAARKARELRYSLAFPVEDQLLALESLSCSDLNGECDRLFSNCHVEALMMGNLNAQDAEACTSIVADALALRDGICTLPVRAEAALPPGLTVMQVQGTDPEERNNCVRVELQLPISFADSVYLSLFTRIVKPRFFEELRTKQQLGYIVQTSWAENEGFLQFACQVQTEYPLDDVRGRIEACLEEQLRWIDEDLTEVEFGRQRDGLASNLAEAPKNLSEEFSRCWMEVNKRRFDFTRRERKLEAVKAANLEHLREFIQGVVRSAPRLSVEVQSIAPGTGKQLPPGGPMPAAPDRIWESTDAIMGFRTSTEWIQLNSEVARQAGKSRL